MVNQKRQLSHEPFFLVVPGLVGGAIAALPLPAIAQLLPDPTLGAEQSIIDSATVRGDLADLIQGGALRDSSLFHSFLEFNVNDGQRVYFFNPEGIETIFGRITGNNPSNIFGTLGVDGAANLFLMNPNGIVFGPNAQLDVEGAFWASTADRVEFGNGSTFSARNPEAAPLVTVNIPIGLQFAADAPAAVRSSAALTAGTDLRLSGGEVISDGPLAAAGLVRVESVAGDVAVRSVEAGSAELVAAGNVVLEESRLETTGDLTLSARDRVRVRDSEAVPIRVAAGGDLVIQGDQNIDILALNHPQTPFVSGGALTLVSDGVISGDTHFASGGDFSMETLAGEPGNFVSLYDPIIISNGNVSLGNYTGISPGQGAASLLVVAAGGITVEDIDIDFPDISLASSPGVPSVISAGVDPDDIAIITIQPSLILRSGVANLPNNNSQIVPNPPQPDLDQANPQFSGVQGTDITLNGAVLVGQAAPTPGRIILQSNSGGSININDRVQVRVSDFEGPDVPGVIELEADGEINFNNGAVIQDEISGGNSGNIFNFNEGSFITSVVAGSGDDIFTLNGGDFDQISGGAGNNTIRGTNGDDIFQINNLDAGFLENDSNFQFDFTEIQNIDGRDGQDTFNFLARFSPPVSVFPASASAGQLSGDLNGGNDPDILRFVDDSGNGARRGYGGISVLLTDTVAGQVSALGSASISSGAVVTRYNNVEILMGDGIRGEDGPFFNPFSFDEEIANEVQGTDGNDTFVATNTAILEPDGTFDLKNTTQLVNFTRLDGSSGNDTFILRRGIVPNDFEMVAVDRPVDEILGGEGNDLVLLQGGSVKNRIDGGTGRLTIEANANNALIGLPTTPNSITGVSGNSTIALQPSDPAQDINLGADTSGLTYNGGTVGAIDSSSFDALIIGREDGTGEITTSGNLNFDLPVTLQNGSIRSGGNINSSGNDLSAIANTGDVNLTGRISTTNPTGNAGIIRIEASSGQVQVSQLEANASGTGNGVAINITGNSISINNGEIRSVALGSGNSGPINLTATREINVNRSAIRTQVDGSGTAGDINIDTSTLNIDGNAVTGGNSTAGGPANTPTPVILAAAATVPPPTPSQPASLADLAKANPNRSEIASRSNTETPETGAAGNISIRAATIALNSGAIITDTERNPDGESGNITLQATGSELTLNNESLIFAQGNGTIGGNIRILGFTTVLGGDPTTGPNGNDIIVNSVGVNRIALIELQDATNFIRQPAVLGNQTNDISSPPLEDPTIEPRIEDPTVEPQKLPEPDTQFINIDQLIRQGCAAKATGLSGSKFEVQGRGGLPDDPLTLLSGGIAQEDWNTLAAALPHLPSATDLQENQTPAASQPSPQPETVASSTHQGAEPSSSTVSREQCVVRWLADS